MDQYADDCPGKATGESGKALGLMRSTMTANGVQNARALLLTNFSIYLLSHSLSVAVVYVYDVVQ